MAKKLEYEAYQNLDDTSILHVFGSKKLENDSEKYEEQDKMFKIACSFVRSVVEPVEEQSGTTDEPTDKWDIDLLAHALGLINFDVMLLRSVTNSIACNKLWQQIMLESYKRETDETEINVIAEQKALILELLRNFLTKIFEHTKPRKLDSKDALAWRCKYITQASSFITRKNVYPIELVGPFKHPKEIGDPTNRPRLRERLVQVRRGQSAVSCTH